MCAPTFQGDLVTPRDLLKAQVSESDLRGFESQLICSLGQNT